MRTTTMEDVQAYISQMRESVHHYRDCDISVMRYSVPLDNHNPIREYGAGYIIRYTNDHVDTGYVMFHDEQFGAFRRGAFLIDDGKTVRPFYLASWNQSGGYFILHPFPIGQDFGPRKMYHVMLAPDATTVLAELIESVRETDDGVTEVYDDHRKEVIELDDFPYVAHVRK